MGSFSVVGACCDVIQMWFCIDAYEAYMNDYSRPIWFVGSISVFFLGDASQKLHLHSHPTVVSSAVNEYLCVACLWQASVCSVAHQSNWAKKDFKFPQPRCCGKLAHTSFVHLSNINSNYSYYFLHSSNTRAKTQHPWPMVTHTD